MSQEEVKNQREKVKISYLFKLAGKRNTHSLTAAVLFSILAGLCSFVPYVMVYHTILFLFTGSGTMKEVLTYGIIAAAAIVLRFVFQALSMGLTHLSAYHILYLVRKRLCSHIGSVNLGFFTDNSTGEIKKVLMEDVERLEKFLAHQIPDITVAMVVPVTVLIYLFTINIPMSLVLLVPIILTFLIQAIELWIARPIIGEIPRVQGRVNSVIFQFVNGMTVMKAYNMTADSYHEYSEAMEDYNSLWKNAAKKLAPLSSIGKVMIESGIFFALPLGGYLYLQNKLGLGEYIFFIVMSIVFLSSYNNLLNFAQIFSQISSGLERIKEVMDLPEVETLNERPAERESHDIEFEHVSFSYKDKFVLQNIDIQMKGGTLTAFVGSSGAGKSTAAQLIPRFWDVVNGRIAIDGTNIKDIGTKELMNLLSFVFQETFMLNDTIYQNIAIGKEKCTMEEVENAAKAAQIHDFIVNLPEGYQTNLGENGVKLSGGEKQRICIARAILKDAPIIIFDEATSYTDGENEHKIQLALENLLKGKTTIMIAHRLHTIIHADQICVFDRGRIVERGTHNHLLEQNGVYRKMWEGYIN